MSQANVGKEFLQSAELLVQQDFLSKLQPDLRMSFQRTTVSRVYYGVFHISKHFADRFITLFKLQSLDDISSNIHTGLVNFYSKNATNMKKEIKERDNFNNMSIKLDSLRKSRNICDYQSSPVLDIDFKVKSSFKLMREIMTELNTLHIWLDSLEKNI